MKEILGIDFGTTNSCAAIYKNGKVEIVFNSGLKALNFAIKYLGYQE